LAGDVNPSRRAFQEGGKLTAKNPALNAASARLMVGGCDLEGAHASAAVTPGPSGETDTERAGGRPPPFLRERGRCTSSWTRSLRPRRRLPLVEARARVKKANVLAGGHAGRGGGWHLRGRVRCRDFSRPVRWLRAGQASGGRADSPGPGRVEKRRRGARQPRKVRPLRPGGPTWPASAAKGTCRQADEGRPALHG